MIDVIFDKDEIYESVNHFLDRSQVCYNFTGEHTRAIYQSKVDDNTNLREGLNRAIMNLDQELIRLCPILLGTRGLN